jgi:hypothetical protein
MMLVENSSRRLITFASVLDIAIVLETACEDKHLVPDTFIVVTIHVKSRITETNNPSFLLLFIKGYSQIVYY